MDDNGNGSPKNPTNWHLMQRIEKSDRLFSDRLQAIDLRLTLQEDRHKSVSEKYQEERTRQTEGVNACQAAVQALAKKVDELEDLLRPLIKTEGIRFTRREAIYAALILAGLTLAATVFAPALQAALHIG